MTAIISVDCSVGFAAHLPVVLDVEDDRHVQEAATVTEIPDETHITFGQVILTRTTVGIRTSGPCCSPTTRSTYRRMERTYVQFRHRHRRDAVPLHHRVTTGA